MPYADDAVWVPTTGFYAQQWRDWLAEREAPELDRWAERGSEFDARLGRDVVTYRVPTMAPPCRGDDAARQGVYDLIRARIAFRAVA